MTTVLWRWMRFALALLLVCCHRVPASPPRLRSAFLDVYPDMLSWSPADWMSECRDMARAGISEVIFPGVVHLFAGTPAVYFYPASNTTLSDPLLSSAAPAAHYSGVVGALLDAAAAANLSVTLGLLRSGYSALPSDPRYITRVAAASAAVLADLAAQHGANPALQGIYLPQELSNGLCSPGSSATHCTICCANCSCCFGTEASRDTLVRSHIYILPLWW